MTTPLLLVHGMCCTGSVWDNYREFFEARGHKVYTPTLRSELRVRRRPPTRQLAQLRFDDYVDELETVVDRIEEETGSTPNVIGHSMGGLLSQALAQRGRARTLIAVSPAPLPSVSPLKNSLITGLAGFGLATGLGPKAILPTLWMTKRDVLNCVAPDERKGHWQAMVHESLSVFANFRTADVNPDKVACPVLIVGCKRDRLVPASWTRKTGAAYTGDNGEYREYAQFGHWFYAEPGWQQGANELAEWIEKAEANQPRLAATA